jgi:hypothetical protein
MQTHPHSLPRGLALGLLQGLALCAFLAHGLVAAQSNPTAPSAATPPSSTQERDALVFIAHASVPHLDVSTTQRLYTGRLVEVAGVALMPVNSAPGSKARERFLAMIVNQDDEKYTAYWTVRKHIGKGTPPRDLKSATEVMDFVQNTPGAVGYVLASEMKPGLNVVLRP